MVTRWAVWTPRVSQRRDRVKPQRPTLAWCFSVIFFPIMTALENVMRHRFRCSLPEEARPAHRLSSCSIAGLADRAGPLLSQQRVATAARGHGSEIALPEPIVRADPELVGGEVFRS